MPPYFFHFRGTRNAIDQTGTQRPDEGSAREHARQIASELARDPQQSEYAEGFIVMADESGREVSKCPYQGRRLSVTLSLSEDQLVQACQRPSGIALPAYD